MLINRIFPKKDVLTIPNAMSFFRLLLIPLFVWLYVGKEQYVLAVVVLAVSSISDVADGIVARKFNMVSEFGKFLDPVADKATQLATVICLVIRYPMVRILVAVMLVKEALMLFTNYLVIRKKEKVFGAEWYGKVNTVIINLSSVVLILWVNIPEKVANVMIIVCIITAVVSFILYLIRNIAIIRNMNMPKIAAGKANKEILEKSGDKKDNSQK